MNSFVERYAHGLHARNRARLEAVWAYLEEVNRIPNDVRGPLPSFGRTAIAFVGEMQRLGLRPRPVPPADLQRTSFSATAGFL